MAHTVCSTCFQDKTGDLISTVTKKYLDENNPNLTSELPHSITRLASRGNGMSVPIRHVNLQSVQSEIHM